MKEIKDFTLICKDVKERDSALGILKKRFGDKLTTLWKVSLNNDHLIIRFWKGVDKFIYNTRRDPGDGTIFIPEIITYQEFLDMMVEEKEFLITRTLNEF